MNKRLQVLIVDDEELARRLSLEYLRSHPDIEVVGECETGLEAVDAISKLNPDMVLLDIQMPQLSGLEVLEITGRRSGVIFTTAYDQYALKAFDLHAVDYLLKPFSQQRFDDALTKARKLLAQETSSSTQAIETLLTQQSEKLQRLLIRDRGQVHVVPLASIDYVEAQDDYILIHAAGKSHMKTQSLSELEAQLDASKFVRVHRSFLLQLNALQAIEKTSKDSQVAVLKNGAQVPVSRAGYERIKALLN
ncbi:LytR/AlgR family response regulator transcription factor [Undibacterium umbellatum]|uniref:Response regulator transcription factor n=1 Tax=Undibacterium umbellatum TaxID=2762300 RepID=A0ABR6ZDH2_9BURK|nr:LytTR family DNA-binding domain-containing protein [Undibacterium umbellatum]MBC3909799.1 response regulator transcription factor [Undibacterium umbellatum]